tara:strand:+ start:3630 stop:3836 length:207 start_codon:yes stop_codon:yes gene_type:complete
MTFEFKHPSYYKKEKEKNKDFLEEIEKDQKILDIGLKESRRAKKERLEKERQANMQSDNIEMEKWKSE